MGHPGDSKMASGLPNLFFGLRVLCGWAESSCRSFSLPRCPFAFNLLLFDGTLNAGSLHSTDHRFAMTCSGRDDRVGEFFSELRFVLDIEIVVALLPEMLGLTDQSPRYSLLPRKGLSGPRFKSPP